MVSFPYYFHTTPTRIPKDMGMVWETYHKGVPLLGVPGITLDNFDDSFGQDEINLQTWVFHHATARICRYFCRFFEMFLVQTSYQLHRHIAESEPLPQTKNNIYMYEYIYIYMYEYIYMCTNIKIYIRICIYIYILFFFLVSFLETSFHWGSIPWGRRKHPQDVGWKFFHSFHRCRGETCSELIGLTATQWKKNQQQTNSWMNVVYEGKDV